MVGVAWQDRIVVDAELHHGEPCVKGTRVPVRMIVGSLADGMSADEIREEYPRRSQVDIQAALGYAAEVLHQEVLIPLA